MYTARAGKQVMAVGSCSAEVVRPWARRFEKEVKEVEEAAPNLKLGSPCNLGFGILCKAVLLTAYSMIRSQYYNRLKDNWTAISLQRNSRITSFLEHLSLVRSFKLFT